MSDHLLEEFDVKEEAASQFSIADLRAMQPIGKRIPNAPQNSLDRFIFTAKVVEKAPDPESPKSHGRLSKLKEKIKATSPAERAYERADVDLIEGKYYCVGPAGQIIQTTITRRNMVSKTEMIFGVVDARYMSAYGQRYE